MEGWRSTQGRFFALQPLLVIFPVRDIFLFLRRNVRSGNALIIEPLTKRLTITAWYVRNHYVQFSLGVSMNFHLVVFLISLSKPGRINTVPRYSPALYPQGSQHIRKTRMAFLCNRSTDAPWCGIPPRPADYCPGKINLKSRNIPELGPEEKIFSSFQKNCICFFPVSAELTRFFH